MKMTIVTPVHVGTGETRMAFEYHNDRDNVKNYALDDIFGQLPSSQLLDNDFLYSLTIQSNKKGNSTRNRLNNALSQIDWDTINPQYTLRYEGNKLLKDNVSVQVKSLDRPYIPGSSIKGAINNAIAYDLSKNHGETFINNLREIDEMNAYQIKKNLSDVYKILFDSIQDDFLKAFRSCILCSDVFFNDLSLMDVKRLHIDEDEKEKSNNPKVDMAECIDHKQSSKGDFISIDKSKVKLLKRQYGQEKYFNEFEQYLNIDKLAEVCNNYFRDLIEEELSVDYDYYFYSKYHLGDALKSYKKNEKHSFYLRLGGNTNYFFKTISYFIKNKYPNDYKYLFSKIFSPASKGMKAKPKSETMPITRSIYNDGKTYYYPGVVKIEYVKD